MTQVRNHAAIVKAEGHLIDSQLLNAIFDAVIERGGAFEVQHFDIGKTNDDFSRLTLKVSTDSRASLDRLVETLIPLGCHVAEEQDARLRVVGRRRHASLRISTPPRTSGPRSALTARGSTSNVSAWTPRSSSPAMPQRCRKLRDVRAGDRIVCGLGGLRVTPEFRDRERSDFAFMANEVSSERRVEASVERIARMMEATKARGQRIAFVAGPVVVHTGGAPYFTALIRAGYVDVLLAGNALAVHDVEAALFGTSLGVDLEAGTAVYGGHQHHMRAINAINRAGGIRPAVETGV